MLTGLGNIAALCSSRRVTINQEWNMFASVGTAAHELGHKSVLTSLYTPRFVFKSAFFGFTLNVFQDLL